MTTGEKYEILLEFVKKIWMQSCCNVCECIPCDALDVLRKVEPDTKWEKVFREKYVKGELVDDIKKFLSMIERHFPDMIRRYTNHNGTIRLHDLLSEYYSVGAKLCQELKP